MCGKNPGDYKYGVSTVINNFTITCYEGKHICVGSVEEQVNFCYLCFSFKYNHITVPI